MIALAIGSSYWRYAGREWEADFKRVQAAWLDPRFKSGDEGSFGILGQAFEAQVDLARINRLQTNDACCRLAAAIWYQTGFVSLEIFPSLIACFSQAFTYDFSSSRRAATSSTVIGAGGDVNRAFRPEKRVEVRLDQSRSSRSRLWSA